MQTRRHRILAQRSQGALAKAKELPTLEVVFGRARLAGPRSATVGAGKRMREIRFKNVILATGSVPSRPPIRGADLPTVLDSKGLIELDDVPKSLVLIGAGPIGVEMAQIFAMLGSKVTLLEAQSRILTSVDQVLADLLAARLVGDGIDVQTAVVIDAIEGQQKCHSVRYVKDGRAYQVSGDVVAIVAGRHPNIEGLGLENTGVLFDQHGVKVDDTLQTDESGVYATGDLVGQPMFAHWATAQALAVARHLLGETPAYPRPEHNSAVIFSYPELGMVGLTEERARAAGLDVSVAEYDYRGDARAQISSEGFGRLRVVYEKRDRRIVGIHALIEGAADLLGEAALAVHQGLSLQDLAMAIHPHPTLNEAFGLVALSALSSG